MTTSTRSSLLRISALAAAAMLLGAGCALPTEEPKPAQPVAPTPAAQTPEAASPTSAPAETTKPSATAPKPKTTAVVPHTSTVLITGYEFSPQVIAITTGDSIVWTNKDPMSHTTVSDNAIIWDSGNIAPGGSYKRVFSSPGTYTYHCGIHPNMKGTVVVRDAVK